jgi:hypothetical protein
MRGDGRIFRRGRIWWVAYSRNGREHRESSRSTDEDVAARLLRKRLSMPTADSLTIRELAKRPEILKELPEQDAKDLYADCMVTMRRLRARLFSKPSGKGV